MKKEAVFPAALPKPVMGYSPVVKAGPLVFVSGQVASDFKTGVPPEARTNAQFPHHGSNIERQTAFIANKLEAALEDAGSSLTNCVFLNLYHTHAHELHEGADENGVIALAQGSDYSTYLNNGGVNIAPLNFSNYASLATITVSLIPIPAALPLLASAIAGLTFVRRRSAM